ncbi:SDR family oxidoreductase [Nostoc sp. FACHB-280]|uniref:SDR family NAD(P)-dependent oxidoreductase n=1 Tax=Nostoc sp. FACHB-280 TaxID=2692839 RepID=UPI00168B975E|nr:SDR family NAD(P)-dependent oxidoreductase [Nostoc sp. FACHB-280]MBD2498934.1 SDR family NAD(P)-dependent oxidoreductase [Nostoc sp. FACHB-280]
MNDWQKRLYSRYGSWAVVTGASSGIGKEMVLRLAEAGLNLVLVARSQDVLEQLAIDLSKRYGVDTRVVRLDLAAETGVDTLTTITQDLDVGLLVTAAGFGTSGSFLDSQLDQEMEMLNVNCRALLALSWYFGQRFANQGRGGMVLISSILGFQGTPFAAHYAATKAYVQTLAEALNVELAPKGVDVIASAPGPTNSGFAERAGMKMGQMLHPREVAQGTLDVLGRKSLVLPGLLTKLLTYLLVPLPRWARVRIMGSVMKSMTH